MVMPSVAGHERRTRVIGAGLVVLALLGACGAPAGPAAVPPVPSAGRASPGQPLAGGEPAPAAAEWVTVATGSLIEVSVERALYEEPAHPRFYVRVRVRNLGPTALGIDLRSYHGIFHPNQWLASTSPHRGSVDERRFLPLGPLDQAEQAATVAAHRAGSLTAVPAQGAVEYYRDFNRSSRNDVDAQARGVPYVLVVIDGQIRATDGRVVERLGAPLTDAPREIAVPAPVRWARVPAGALVMRDR